MLHLPVLGCESSHPSSMCPWLRVCRPDRLPGRTWLNRVPVTFCFRVRSLRMGAKRAWDQGAGPGRTRTCMVATQSHASNMLRASPASYSFTSTLPSQNITQAMAPWHSHPPEPHDLSQPLGVGGHLLDVPVAGGACKAAQCSHLEA